MSKILPFVRPSVNPSPNKPARRKPVRVPADTRFAGAVIVGRPLPARRRRVA